MTWRAWIDVGWLVSTWSEKCGRGDAKEAPVPDGTNWGGGLTFVPDPDGKWKPEVDKGDER